jgi:hypothetical protein
MCFCVRDGLMDIEILQMFSPTVDKSKSSYTFSEMSYFYEWKYAEYLASQIEFCGTMAQSSLAPIKPGRMASQCYMLKSQIIFLIYENVYLKLFIRI